MRDGRMDGTWKPTRLTDSWWRSVAGQLAFSVERSSAPARENRTLYTYDNNFTVSQCFKKPVQVTTCSSVDTAVSCLFYRVTVSPYVSGLNRNISRRVKNIKAGTRPLSVS